ncbi:low affinity potassium transporter [Elasticomyces elasticus]|nr:low affinity potassium transporter [Elasticomyces elasticus]KAK3645473.1 low affinity potassium transporter [Elasticomyces elasticus]KAK4915829.1 low affinity potassium transporter [Elasticomyces elasticus]KAK5755575.1 low affinity potassium transporter [Elasticomyces elasticus]
MYLSVFPLITPLRSTNIYEERSVSLEADIYKANRLDKEKSRSEKQNPFTGTHLNDAAGGYNSFTILFEVISAYGNCGLTLRVLYDSFAPCGSFHALSKLVLITVLLRGRHRKLPMALDRSILLPGQEIMLEMDKHYNAGISEERDVDEVGREERGGQAEDPKGKQDPANDGKRRNGQDND